MIINQAWEKLKKEKKEIKIIIKIYGLQEKWVELKTYFQGTSPTIIQSPSLSS